MHCGFCLPTCPTYLLWGEEMDSPRGRIDIMKSGLEGAPLEPSSVQHLDQCLGCMACVTACPSGVQYDKLIESTRAQIERRVERPRGEKALREMIFQLFPYPRRLKVLRGPLRAYQASGLGRVLARSGLMARMPAGLQAMESLAPKLGKVEKLAERTPAQGTKRRTVGLLTGCVQGTFFPDVNAATVRVLAAEGCEVVVPKRQGCCGALSAHGGREDEALSFAKQVIEVFERAGVETVVVNAAGCGSNLKEYGHQLRDEPEWAARAEALAEKVRDVTELHRRARAGRRAAPARGADRLPGRLPPGPRAGRARAAPPAAARHPGRRAARSSPRPRSAAAAPARTTCCTPSRRRSSASARPARCSPRAPASWSRPTRAAGCRWPPASPGWASRMPVAHTVQVLDASISGTPVARLLATALDGPGTVVSSPVRSRTRTSADPPAPGPVPASSSSSTS